MLRATHGGVWYTVFYEKTAIAFPINEIYLSTLELILISHDLELRFVVNSNTGI